MNYKERTKIIVELGKRGFSYRAIAQWARMSNENPVSRERIRQILVAELGEKEVKRMTRAKKGRGDRYSHDSWGIITCKKCGKKFLGLISSEKKFCSYRCFKINREEKANKRALKIYGEIAKGLSISAISKIINVSYTTAHRDYSYAVKKLGMPELNLWKRYQAKRVLSPLAISD